MANESPDAPTMAPDKPPKGGGSCCDKIATFLSIGPEVRISFRLGGETLEVAFGLGRRPR